MSFVVLIKGRMDWSIWHYKGNEDQLTGIKASKNILYSHITDFNNSDTSAVITNRFSSLTIEWCDHLSYVTLTWLDNFNHWQSIRDINLDYILRSLLTWSEHVGILEVSESTPVSRAFKITTLDIQVDKSITLIEVELESKDLIVDTVP
jgi:hypothetical protein